MTKIFILLHFTLFRATVIFGISKDSPCPADTKLYRGTIGYNHFYCNTLVPLTFEKRGDETWPEHFKQECEKLFVDAFLEYWPLASTPAAGRLRSPLSSIGSFDAGDTAMINGFWMNIIERSHDTITLEVVVSSNRRGSCTYTRQSNKDWEITKNFSDCYLPLAHRHLLNTIKGEWKKVCPIHRYPPHTKSERALKYLEFYDCLNEKHTPEMFGLCIHRPLYECGNLIPSKGCEFCYENYQGQLCTINPGKPCQVYPCGSYGTCIDTGDKQFECVCDALRGGRFCEMSRHACAFETCKNGGTCARAPEDEFVCTCAPGYTGKTCESDIDECASQTMCQNGGICRNTFGSFKCECGSDYTGALCEIIIEKPKHCPYDVEMRGGQDKAQNACLTIVSATFSKHFDKTWPVHFAKECMKKIPGSQLHGWSPNQLLTRPTILNEEMGVSFQGTRLSSVQLINGLWYAITEWHPSLIKAIAKYGNQGAAVAVCEFKAGDMGIWTAHLSSGKSAACDFSEQLLEKFKIIKSDWKAICIYADIQSDTIIWNHMNSIIKTYELFDCISEKLSKMAAACRHSVLMNCKEFVSSAGCTKCQNNMKGKFCAIDPNKPCDLFPCGSYGTCVHAEGTKFSCECDEYSFGELCEYEKDPCSSDSCHNGGTCQAITRQRFRCLCTVGFEGEKCEKDIDECKIKDICKNGGTCVNTMGSYKCMCIPGITGPNCEQNIDDCVPNKCVHSKTCIDLINDYKCVCEPGFTGKNCELDYDECQSDPCKNGGTCENRNNAYYCRCKLGFTGPQCTGDIVKCEKQTCSNHGSCLEVQNGIRCTCDPKYTGQFCETERILCGLGVCGPGKCIQRDLDFVCDCSNTGLGGAQCNERTMACVPSPCLNGGSCIEGMYGAICQCKQGFAGRYCGATIDPCEHMNPCKNGGTCLWIHNATSCVCKSGVTGRYCTESAIPYSVNISSESTMRIPLVWYILGIGAILIIVLLLFGICAAKRKRRRYSRSETSHRRGRWRRGKRAYFSRRQRSSTRTSQSTTTMTKRPKYTTMRTLSSVTVPRRARKNRQHYRR